jgi:hypothetical protein
MKIWHMHIASWNVIIAFPLQQWLRERASLSLVRTFHGFLLLNYITSPAQTFVPK